jgi:hypothetical protein
MALGLSVRSPRVVLGDGAEVRTGGSQRRGPATACAIDCPPNRDGGFNRFGSEPLPVRNAKAAACVAAAPLRYRACAAALAV